HGAAMSYLSTSRPSHSPAPERRDATPAPATAPAARLFAILACATLAALLIACTPQPQPAPASTPPIDWRSFIPEPDSWDEQFPPSEREDHWRDLRQEPDRVDHRPLMPADTL